MNPHFFGRWLTSKLSVGPTAHRKAARRPTYKKRRCTFEQLEVRSLLTTVLDFRITADANDAEERANGRVDLTSSDLELVYDKSDQTVGLRFEDLNVPRGASIVNAYVQFQVDEPSSDATFLLIEGQATDDAPAFIESNGNLSSRPRTGASVAWSPVPWPSPGEAGLDQRTPNVSSIIQELVNRPGWSSGNALVVMITGTGERVAESYSGDPTGAPLLHIEYDTDDPPLGNSPPQVADQTFQVAENSAAGTVVGSVIATDPDVGQNLSYAIVAGNTESAFEIDVSSGLITVANSAAIDLETTPSFYLTVQVTDDGLPVLSDMATITIIVHDANEPPATIVVAGGGSAAIQAAVNSAMPGDIIQISAGNYDDAASPIEITTSGIASSPITLRAAAGARPVLPLLELTDVKHWRFEGFEISNHPGERAIEVLGPGSENLVFENLLLHHLASGIRLEDGTDFEIRDSVIYELTDGVRSDATGISIFKAKNIAVRNNEIYDFTGDAIHANDGSDDIYVNRELILVDGNHIYIARQDYRSCSENAIDVKGEYGGTVIFSNNIVHGFDEYNGQICTGPSASGGSDGSAVNMNSKLDSGGSHAIVKGNLIYDGNLGVDTNLWSAEIYNNVFYELAKQAISVGSDELVEIYHNTFVSMPEAIGSSFADLAIVSNNLFHNAGSVPNATTNNAFFGTSYSTNPPGTNPITGTSVADEPGLVDPANLDFHLRADSPLIDAGTNLGILTDMAGELRDGNPDIGALEYVSGPDRSAPTATLSSPQDNGPNDFDTSFNSVLVTSTQPTFEIQLSDTSGIDDTTVNVATVSVTKDSNALIESTDYTFSYDAATDVITLTSLIGHFDDGSYDITLSSGATTINDIIGNAMSSTMMTVKIATTDIAVTAVNAPSSVTQGNVASVDVTVANIGDQDVLSDIVVSLSESPDNISFSAQTISGGLVAGASTTITFIWDTSGASSGDHTLTASHAFTDDISDNNSESSTVSVVAANELSVVSIDPNSVPTGGSVDVIIRGTGFENGANVELAGGEGPQPRVSNVVVVDSTTITATIITKDGGPRRDRLWDVVVTNMDGMSAVLESSFAVTVSTGLSSLSTDVFYDAYGVQVLTNPLTETGDVSNLSAQTLTGLERRLAEAKNDD